MTKGELIGGAYLKLVGGYPTTDSSVWWDDVDQLFAPAVNYVMMQDYFIGKRDEGEDKIIQPMFLQTFKNIPITYDTETEKYKSILPKRPMAFPKNRAVSYVGSALGHEFIPIEQGGRSMQKYYQLFKTCETSYELQGQEIIYENPPPLLDKVMVKMIVSAKSITDDEEVPLPEGGEIQVMTLMVEFFTGQKLLPKDYYNTNKDIQTPQ